MTQQKPVLLALQGLSLLGIAAVLVLGRLDQRRAAEEQQLLQSRLTAAEAQLQILANEMTRFRIEQPAKGKGVDAVLEKLTAYAPQLTSAAVAEPQFRYAQKEMQAALRATASLGKAAFEPLRQRFLDLGPERFDEKKWLLEAMVAADRARGTEFVNRVLEGHHREIPVSARLRFYAADMLVLPLQGGFRDALDKRLGGLTLRGILRTESARGINPDRVAAYNLPVPETNLVSANFENFVPRYLLSDDDEKGATLLMMLGRSEHDLKTIQECVKALGELKVKDAVPAIEKLYANQPVIRDNPIFQGHCLQALVDIQGEAARPFLQQALREAGNELTANRAKHLLEQLDAPPPAKGGPPAMQAPGTGQRENK